MMMMQPYLSEPQGQGPSGAVIEALPAWQEAGELGDHRQYIFHYHTMMCPQFANGYCPRHKGSRSSPPQCFCYHFESQRRRPLVDTLTGQLKYWDVLCEHIANEEECSYGDLCPFAHTREEISYHAAKYKTKFCNDRDCRGQEVCCFAHGDAELRAHAIERYSYWSVLGGMSASPTGMQGMGSDLTYMGQQGVNSRNNSTGALYHPKVYKHRFCASYPHIASCRRGDACAFAHTREEIRTPLLADEEEEQRASALTNDFFMHRFKTLWCPVGVQHDWQTCVYAHNYQDARRHPSIGYGPRPCLYWKRKETALEYSQRCPLGVGCPFSHGAKEQLYHPTYFKTVTCQDWPNSNCPRGPLCAFWHKRSQQRARPSDDEFDYKKPIPEKRLQDGLQPDFLSPPFKLLNSLQADPHATTALEAWSEMGPADYGMGDFGMVSDGAWGQQLCGYGGNGGSPATPTTAADSDEAASADSSNTDKYPTLQEEENFGGQWSQWQNMNMCGQMNGGYGGSGPGQMMWFQVPAQGMQGPHQQEGAGPDGFSGNSAAPGVTGPASSECAVAAPLPMQGEQSPNLEGQTMVGAGPQQFALCEPCGSSMPYGMNPYECPTSFNGPGGMMYPAFGPDYSGAMGYGGGMGQPMPYMYNGFRMMEMNPSAEVAALCDMTGQLAFAAQCAAMQPSEAAEAEKMPTHNGFIHFKEPVDGMEGSDDESPRAGARRPRAMSH